MLLLLMVSFVNLAHCLYDDFTQAISSLVPSPPVVLPPPECHQQLASFSDMDLASLSSDPDIVDLGVNCDTPSCTVAACYCY